MHAATPGCEPNLGEKLQDSAKLHQVDHASGTRTDASFVWRLRVDLVGGGAGRVAGGAHVEGGLLKVVHGQGLAHAVPGHGLQELPRLCRAPPPQVQRPAHTALNDVANPMIRREK